VDALKITIQTEEIQTNFNDRKVIDMLLVEFMEVGTTINAAVYCQTL
jgi:hypothetical protein